MLKYPNKKLYITDYFSFVQIKELTLNLIKHKKNIHHNEHIKRKKREKDKFTDRGGR